MFGEKFQRTYALTDQGVKNTKRGALFTVITNLVVMAGTGILYLVMGSFMETLIGESAATNILVPILLIIAFLVLSFITHYLQYKATYGLVYGEVKTTRLHLAERLRKLPLGYFGKRDLADLTETLMGDVNRNGACMESCFGIFVWCLYLYGHHCDLFDFL